MKYKAVCFDVDSTLYPPEFENKLEKRLAFRHPVLGKRYSKSRTLMRKYQDNPEPELEGKDFSYIEAEMFRRAMGEKVSFERARRILECRFYRALRQEFSSLGYQKDTVELFKLLKDRGIKIGIFSDWPLWDKLERIGVSQYCDVKDDPYGTGYLKPDSHVFEKLLYNLNLSASEVLYVGDSYTKDVEGAVGAGIDAVLVGHEDNGKYPKALKVFKNLKDFTFWMEAN